MVQQEALCIGGILRYVVKVSRKGQIVIPVEIRRRFGISDKVVIRVDESGIRIIPLKPLDELFGVDGEIMKEVAREIVRERLEEVKREK
ncbi:MAG: AbrB family transcriptional regulator [Desulfurococcales archaeon ex4484_58]|nr:MAG: AbrB family transcriptional regulator [Desulfurococcales archaeon ex4484_58]